MMDSLLSLKEPTSEYFRQHFQNARKLTPHEWTVTNEVCSLLDDVSEVTIRMQGAGDTHVSQAMAVMTEVTAMLKEESHPIRLPNTTVLRPPPDGHSHGIDSSSGAYLGGARRAGSTSGGDGRQGCGEGLGEGGASVALLGPRWKALGADQLVNGSAALRTRANEDLKGVFAEFADAQTQPSAPVPAPVLDVEPAKPAPKKKRLSRLEVRVRAGAGCGSDRGSAESQAAVTGRRVLVEREVLVYSAEQGQLDVDAFNLLGFRNGGVPTAYAR